jgi:hypothetical protein
LAIDPARLKAGRHETGGGKRLPMKKILVIQQQEVSSGCFQGNSSEAEF